MNEINANNLFIELINKQKEKEEQNDIWKNSLYKDVIKLQINNVGNLGEIYMKNICEHCNINSNINGYKTKKTGGGYGDGDILNKLVEIKTSYKSSKFPVFQHELGEKPWHTDYMIFIDIDIECIYLTIFKNFNEEFYKSGLKCKLYFPTKSITWRKKCGEFKLDTTIKINEENITKGYTIKINNETQINDIKLFILSQIK